MFTAILMRAEWTMSIIPKPFDLTFKIATTYDLIDVNVLLFDLTLSDEG